jgi:hypothetical protein
MEQPTPPAPFIAEVRRYQDHRGIVIEELHNLSMGAADTFGKIAFLPFSQEKLPVPRFHIQMNVIAGPDKQHLMQIPIHAAFDAENIQAAFAKAEAEIQAALHAEIKRKQEEASKPKLALPH